MMPLGEELQARITTHRDALPKATGASPETIAFLQTVGALRALSERLDSQAMDADVGVAGYMLSQAVREAAQRLAVYVALEHPGNG